MSPFIRLSVEGQEAGKPALVAEEGMYGLLPHFAAEQQYGRRTYSARSETVHKLASFKPSWDGRATLHHPGRGGLRAEPCQREPQGAGDVHVSRG